MPASASCDDRSYAHNEIKLLLISWLPYTPSMPGHLHRYQQRGDYHFVTFSCYGRRPLLEDERMCILFEDVLERLRRRHEFCVFGYVLMPEHVHLLISEPKTLSLSKVVGALKTDLSKHRRSDEFRFWEKRYYDFNVFTQAKHTEKLRYLHRNPVRRGLVVNPEEWLWSSFYHYLTGEIGRVEIESHWTVNRRSLGL
ncbi:REP-associated tyrosine transposase [Silvibacterium sp.]|uniref:REP-associated tyrosine transposase n=1 Tax=Silvibacterium sp. TaxID=1964179 RepID=UPI0039E6C529